MRSGLLCVLSLAVLGAGCAPRRERLPASDVEFAGCGRVLAGPVCALGRERTVTLWVRLPFAAEVTLRAGGEELTAEGTQVQGGKRFSLTVPEGAGALDVMVVTPKERRAYTLRLDAAPVFPRVEAAQALRRRGEAARAEAELSAALEELPRDERAAALGVIGRIALAAGRGEEAATWLERALALDEEIGCLSCSVLDASALAFALTYHGRRFQRVREILARGEASTRGDPQSEAYLPYHRGVTCFESGDLHSSMRELERAREVAQRLGLDEMHRSALQAQAITAQALGNHAVAADLLQEVQQSLPNDEGDSCERAVLLDGLGWVRLAQAETTANANGVLTEAEPLFRAALSYYLSTCARPMHEAATRVNLAHAALLRGRFSDAREHLRHSEALLARPEPRLRLWQLDLSGRIALASGRPAQAERFFAELDRLGDSVEGIEARWRAAQGRAQTLLVLGRAEEALAKFEHAEHLLEEAAVRVAMGDGRDAFFGSYARGTVAYVLALLDRGDAAEAARVARRGRSRLLASLARVERVAVLPPAERGRWEAAVGRYREGRDALERAAVEEWQLAGDALARAQAEREAQQKQLREALDEAASILVDGVVAGAPPRPAEGELLLVYYPLGQSWAGFAVDEGSTLAARLDRDAAVAPERALQPFDSQIERARRIRVVAVGAFDAVDLHAAPWRGRPLLAHVPVAYGHDGSLSPATPLSSMELAATVIADPGGNLPGARREAAEVGELLAARGWKVSFLTERDAAAASVARAASASTLLHYAGHAEFGRAAWESGLRVAGGGLFGVGDILTLRSVPRLVVLAACETARAGGAAVSGVSVAQAFVGAGAAAAVASSRLVGDAESRALMRAFYRHLERLDAWGVAEALRKAQLELSAEHPPATWAAFRALIP